LIVIRTGQRTGSRRTKNRCQVVIAEPDDDRTVVVGGSLRDRVAIGKLQAALLNEMGLASRDQISLAPMPEFLLATR
jgi:hypothetical protein